MLRGFKRAFSHLYHGDTRFDFVGRFRYWIVLSGAVILAGIISLAVQGLNFSIEFVGGTAWQLPDHGVSVAQAHNALDSLGLSGATVQILGTGNSATLHVEDHLIAGKGQSIQAFEEKVAATLARLARVSPKAVSIEEVGPSWGSQITQKAIKALIIFFIGIVIFIWIFFEWRMALAALVAVAHDIMVTVGIYSISGFQVTPDTVVAFLTILGYSMYDTMVVFDRVKENLNSLGQTGRYTVAELVNMSVNQVLARSINTTLVAVFPILSVLVVGADILGATTLQFFGLALLIGLLTGAYSSIFIASPLYAILKRRQGKFRAVEISLAQARAAKEPVRQEEPVVEEVAVAAAVSNLSHGVSRVPAGVRPARPKYKPRSKRKKGR